MSVKRKLKSIRLDKIAAVDLPCQEGATIALIKRAPEGAAPPAIVKKTFQEALNAQLVSEKVSDTFWRAFENQWAVKDAFRVALTDELAEGGDGYVATAAFTAAMQELASAAAEAARTAASTAETDLEAAVEEAVSKWLHRKEQTMKITTKAQLRSAVAAFDPATSPAAHIETIHKAARDLGAEDELPAEGLLALKAAPAEDKTVKALQREVAVLKMAPEVRAHYEALPEAEQDGFLAKSADEQKAAVAEAQSADPVVYKCKDGTEIRKSDGSAAVLLAKRNDELAGELRDLRGTLDADSIEKRATREFANVALATAVSMLKSAKTVGEDTDAGKDILKSLKQMNDARKTLFKNLGSADGGDVPADITKARTDFNTEVEKVARESKISRSEAMSKVRAERPDLFKAAFPETTALDEEVEA